MPSSYSGGGGINISMPTYSDSLSESLKAQTDLLRGTGDFAESGKLQDILQLYERPLRMQQAQTETDVLLQTILGNRVPYYGDTSERRVLEQPQQTTQIPASADPLLSSIAESQPAPAPQPVVSQPPAPIIDLPATATAAQDPIVQELKKTPGSTPSDLNFNSNTPADIKAAVEKMEYAKTLNDGPEKQEAFKGALDELSWNDGTLASSLGKDKYLDTIRDMKLSIESGNYEGFLNEFDTQISDKYITAPSSTSSSGRRAGSTQVSWGNGTVNSDGRVKTGDNADIDPNLRYIYENSQPGNREEANKLSESVKKLKTSGLLQDLVPEDYPLRDGYDKNDSFLKDALFEIFYNQESPALEKILKENESKVNLNTFLKNDNIDGADDAYKQFKEKGGTLSREEWGRQDFQVPKDSSGKFITEADYKDSIAKPSTSPTTDPTTSPATDPIDESPGATTDQPTITPTGYARAGDGMIDILGDKRLTQDGRMAGFADAQGNEFLGLAALAEDIQRGNLSRQREADLTDVERLSGRFQSVMEDYKPAATSGIQGAKDLIEEQKDKLTSGDPTITIPTTDTYGGDVIGQTMTAATIGDTPTLSADTSFTAASVADPLALNAATSYDPSAGVTGDGYTATAGLQGGNIGADALRAALLADAEGALGQGLTDREKANISNAARARSTLMGRTFDQSGAIKEAQALVAEDNNRLMQNRGFAQSALGQEADIQRDDLTRGLQANMQNQSALNRAAEFGASQSMQAQLANQAATNQASQAGMTAGLSQEALGAQQAQAKAMADAQMLQQSRAMGLEAGMQQDAQQAQFDQQANLAQAELNQQASAFDAQSAQQANVVNQGQAQQAAQFGVGATMDAERLNEQLRQQGLGNYINAVGNLAQIEDQYTLDPFQAILGRAGGGSLAAGSGLLNQASYGSNTQPSYINPESGLGYISTMATNNANLASSQYLADSYNQGNNLFGNILQTSIGILPGLING